MRFAGRTIPCRIWVETRLAVRPAGQQPRDGPFLRRYDVCAAGERYGIYKQRPSAQPGWWWWWEGGVGGTGEDRIGQVGKRETF